MLYNDFAKERTVQCKRAIDKVKTRLVVRAEGSGIWENFGQKELRKFNDDYFSYGYECKEIRDMLSAFNDWAMNYTGRLP